MEHGSYYGPWTLSLVLRCYAESRGLASSEVSPGWPGALGIDHMDLSFLGHIWHRNLLHKSLPFNMTLHSLCSLSSKIFAYFPKGPGRSKIVERWTSRNFYWSLDRTCELHLSLIGRYHL